MLGYALLLYSITLVNGAANNNPSTTPFNEWPMVMAHDAATTYLDPTSLLSTWTQTQTPGGIEKLLQCGARGFDWRPRLKDSELIMHHGPVSIDYPMASALDELLEWTSSHPSLNDFVVLSIVDCDGGESCVAATKALLRSKGIHFIDNCTELEGMTAEKAWQMGQVAGNGGSVLAVFGCKDGYYDPSVTCSGFDLKEGIYTCYANSPKSSFPYDRLWNYAAKVVASGPQAGLLYTLQMIWQESDESVVIGELHGSSLLKDEEWSKINQQVAARLTNGQIDSSRLNFVEINNVCDHGLTVLQALRQSRGIPASPVRRLRKDRLAEFRERLRKRVRNLVESERVHDWLAF